MCGIAQCNKDDSKVDKYKLEQLVQAKCLLFYVYALTIGVHAPPLPPSNATEKAAADDHHHQYGAHLGGSEVGEEPEANHDQLGVQDMVEKIRICQKMARLWTRVARLPYVQS